MHYVIIGSGASGLKAAVTIRENDPKGEITLVSSDLWPLYIKPVLADYIAGRIDFSRMAFMSAEKVEELRITMLCGKRVSSIVPEKNTLNFSDGTTLTYQFLCFATGARPQVPAAYLPFQGRLKALNTLSDAVRIKNESQRSNKAVVIGGGHHGVEMLRALKFLKFDLTLLTNEEDFWEKGHPIPREDVIKKLEENKIPIQWNNEIADIIDLDGESIRLITRDRSIIDTQMVLYAPIFVPNSDFVAGSSIKTDRGILVSEDLRTNIPNIFACGDVAQVYDLNKKISRINFGWTSASKQGEIAGLNMVGRDTVFIPAHEEYFRELYGTKLLNRW